MNTKNILLCIFLIVYSSISQNWVNNYSFPSGYEVTQIQFLNSNTGWLTAKHDNYLVTMYKTTDKGRNWTDFHTFDVYHFSQDLNTYFVFTDVFTGYRAHLPSDRTHTILDKTTDGGLSWNRKIDGFSEIIYMIYYFEFFNP